MPFLTQSKLEEQGARFVASDDFTSHLEEDRKFITGQNPQSSEVIGKALVNALKKMKHKIIWTDTLFSPYYFT